MTTFVVLQRREKYARPAGPAGPFSVREVEKITAKCIFLKRKYGAERFYKEEYFFREFTSKDEASAWVAGVTDTANVGEFEREYSDARAAKRAARKALADSLKHAGALAWAETED